MAFSRGTVIRSFLWKFFEKISSQLIQFIVTIVLARLLLPSEYGSIALITIFIALCSVIIDGGFNTALVQKQNADNLDFSTILYFSIGLSVFLYGVMFICAPLIATFYNDVELIPVIRVLSLTLPFFAINSIQRAYVSKKMLFKRLFYSSLGAIALSGAIGIYMAYHGYGVWALVAQSLSSQIITTLIMWYTLKWRPITEFSIERFKGLFDYGWKIFGANFITTLFINARKLVIGKLFAPASLACYEKGGHIPSMVVDNVFSSIQAILLPTLSETQDNKGQVKSMMRRSTKLSCFVIYPLMMLMIVSAQPLVVLLLTEKWIGAVPFVQILSLSYFLRPITISNWEAIKALGYSSITLKLEIYKKFIDISILICTAFVSVYAIAWGQVLFNVICVFINLAPNKKLLNYGISEQLRDALPSFFISLVGGACAYCALRFPLPNIWILVIQFFILTVTYLGLSILFKEESCMYILQIVKDNKSKFKL